MRISHGKYILTNKAQIEGELKQMDKQAELMRAQLNLVQQWARAQLDLHQPYANAVDISCSSVTTMKADLVSRLEKNLWCSRCSNPWPCKHIGHLQELRNIAGRVTDLGDLEELCRGMNAIVENPKRRDGQIEVRL